MAHGLSKALEFALSTTWALDPRFHHRMMQILVRHAEGVRLLEAEIEAATGTTMPKRGAEMRIEGRTAVVPIHGVIAHRAAAVGRVSSRVGTSVEHIRDDLQAALDNADVDSILLDVDSPGGSVSGIEELAAEIRTARARKPIVAHCDGMMASAAYWLGSQATRVVASRSGAVGSIGVIAAFYDDHRAAANQGFDPIVIKSTPAKGGMQGNGTLSDADRADVQREVDQYHRLFVEAVAGGRGITIEKATELADGRIYIGAEAQQRGFVDAVASQAAALEELRAHGAELRTVRRQAKAGTAHQASSSLAPIPASQASRRALVTAAMIEPPPAVRPPPSPPTPLAAAPEGEGKWRAEFAASRDLQVEFAGDVSLYIGWKRNEQARGRL